MSDKRKFDGWFDGTARFPTERALEPHYVHSPVRTEVPKDGGGRPIVACPDPGPTGPPPPPIGQAYRPSIDNTYGRSMYAGKRK